MPDEALILRNDQARTVKYTETALALKTSVLEQSALIARVKSPEDQTQAIEATRQLKRVDADAEKARKACKEPVIKFGRDIDQAHALYTRELREEIMRLDTLVAGFQQLERARLQAEQQRENERLTQLERERAAEVAQAKSLEEVDEIKAQYCERAALEVAPVKPIARAEGQAVLDDWEVEVTDIWLLARAHPACVKIEPLVSQIKGLLKAGVKEIAGVRATPKLRNVVRAAKEVRAIEI